MRSEKLEVRKGEGSLVRYLSVVSNSSLVAISHFSLFTFFIS